MVRQQPYWDTGADHQVIEEKINCMQQDWNHWGLYQPHCCSTKALQQSETLQWLPKLNHVYFYIPSPGWVTWWSGWGEPVSYCHAIMLDLTTWYWQVYLILEEARPKTFSLQHLQLPLEVYLWPAWRPSNISAPCGYLAETPLPVCSYIYSHTWSEYMYNIGQVLEELWNSRLMAKPCECLLVLSKAPYLGYQPEPLKTPGEESRGS